jgi:hypothetical protein
LDETDELFVSRSEEKGGSSTLNHRIHMEIFHLLRPVRNVLSQKSQKGIEIGFENTFNLLRPLGSTGSQHQLDERLHLRTLIALLHFNLNFRQVVRLGLTDQNVYSRILLRILIVFDVRLSSRGGGGCGVHTSFFQVAFDLLHIFEKGVLGLPDVVLGGGFERTVVLDRLGQIDSGFVGVAIVEFAEHLLQQKVTLLTEPGYW